MTLNEYLAEHGRQAALAQELGVPRPLLSQWKNGGRQVPAERCPQIERATGGAVRCEELRPDVAWDVLRMQAIEPAAVTNPERRVSTEPNPFPDLDRRAAVQGA